MITCRELSELLLDLTGGELPPHQAQQVEQHLGQCRHCVVYVDTYRITVSMVRKLHRPPLPPRLIAKLQAIFTKSSRQADGDQGTLAPPD